MTDQIDSSLRRRARDLGVAPGIFPCGHHNAITDVAGVKVGHKTVVDADGGRTGATAIIQHAGNVFMSRVPAGLCVANGHGKFVGGSQIEELGELETPIILTNTLATPEASAALIEWTLGFEGNGDVRSVNSVVGETNDSSLNPIRLRRLTKADMTETLALARPGAVEEGAVGAGAGVICCGWKAGMGTSSRIVTSGSDTYTVGCIVQSNFDGLLRVLGAPVYKLIDPNELQDAITAPTDGSIMIIVGTDAPLSDRNLKRLAFRAICGLAATGASMANNSGDYALAFSTSELVRRDFTKREAGPGTVSDLPNTMMSSLFQATIEATEEAIYNSLFMAKDAPVPRSLVQSKKVVRALPLDRLADIIGRCNF